LSVTELVAATEINRHRGLALGYKRCNSRLGNRMVQRARG